MTHEDENPVSIFLPALGHFVVFIVCGFGVYGEERPGAVTKVGFSVEWLTRRQLRVVSMGPLNVLMTGLRH